MDQEKMAEGRRQANERRRLEEEQKLADKKAVQSEREEQKKERLEQWERKQVSPEIIVDFEQLEVQLTTFYDELSILSKKTPDAPLNKFKLKYVNDTLKKANTILGDTYRPFPD